MSHFSFSTSSTITLPLEEALALIYDHFNDKLEGYILAEDVYALQDSLCQQLQVSMDNPSMQVLFHLTIIE